MSSTDKAKLDGIASSISDVCKFNFINSISECKSDRINFLFRCTDYITYLDPFDSYPDGTILLITTNENYNRIVHQSGIWYSCGNINDANHGYSMLIEDINLITKNNGIVHHYKLS